MKTITKSICLNNIQYILYDSVEKKNKIQRIQY